ncbi:putative thioredoxin-like thiol-disulfide oxidoreductase [Candidatus Fokinia solitaria]|uniref:Putative thioredoxin-like thiol-disulfide oxidoreductase n=2 Tax=Candidatus Fokinia solitaria TaxID=1802984 RepID=A0A2U8BSC2_9RICK|nr:putative thioredoxin-like thiol-disulfide oxidoreductase [Candidatus Fokinia solitaria]
MLLCIGILCCNAMAFAEQSILQVVKFDDVREEFKVDKKKFVVFFTSWCGHCKDRLPAVADLVSRTKEAFYFISLDENLEYAENFLKSLKVKKGKNMKFFIFDNEDSIAKFVYQFTPTYSGSVPYLMVLDKDNVLHYEGSLSLNSITSLLGKEIGGVPK